MTLIIQKPTGAKLNLRKTWQPMDPDAAAYITAVETADTESLEERTKIAIDNFVLGCKADGIWSAIKASCILAGARTLTGALVPLVGTAPTNFNFVAGDYNRKTGLIGNLGNKYLDSNRNNNADPQNSNHNAAYVTARNNDASVIMGAGGLVVGANLIREGGDVRNRDNGSLAATTWSAPGFIGASRSVSDSFLRRAAASNQVIAKSSQTPYNQNVLLYRREPAGDTLNGGARLAYNSIGEALYLALLDGRVTDLINAFGVAIP